jgi:hypothetical protein
MVGVLTECREGDLLDGALGVSASWDVRQPKAEQPGRRANGDDTVDALRIPTDGGRTPIEQGSGMTATNLQVGVSLLLTVAVGLSMVAVGTRKRVVARKKAPRRCSTCGRALRHHDCPCRR